MPRTRPPQYDLPKAAPAPLRLVQLFLNTSNHETGRELLATPGSLSEWFGENGVPVGWAGEADLARAVRLRDGLRAMITTGEPAEALPDAATRAELTIAFDPPRLVPRVGGVDGALGLIVVVVYEALRDGSWQRLKTCRNCGWAFWDESKNRSAVWCSMQLCGSRLKARRYRGRHGADRGTRRR